MAPTVSSTLLWIIQNEKNTPSAHWQICCIRIDSFRRICDRFHQIFLQCCECVYELNLVVDGWALISGITVDRKRGNGFSGASHEWLRLIHESPHNIQWQTYKNEHCFVSRWMQSCVQFVHTERTVTQKCVVHSLWFYKSFSYFFQQGMIFPAHRVIRTKRIRWNSI